MAIRHMDKIDRAVNSIDGTNNAKMEDAKREAEQMLSYIYRRKDSLIDALDTLGYIREKGLERFVTKEYEGIVRFDVWRQNGNKDVIILDAPKEGPGYREVHHGFLLEMWFDGKDLYCGHIKTAAQAFKVETVIKNIGVSYTDNASGEDKAVFYYSGRNNGSEFFYAEDFIEVLRMFKENALALADRFFENVKELG